MNPTHHLARALAGHGLAGATGSWPSGPLSREEWSALLHDVRAQRLSGLLVEALASGALPSTVAQRDEASEVHFSRMCGVLLLESSTLQLLHALDEVGVETRVLKGSAVAHLDYPDPSLRPFADVDLLVRSCQVDLAVRVLTSLDHVRHSVEPRPGFDRRFGKGATFSSPNGHEVDLHRTFVMGPYGLRLRLDDLWERSATFSLAGRPVAALDPECRFLHACYHAALGDPVPRLVPLRDVAQMVLNGGLDLDRVTALTRSWQAEPVVARAVRLTWEWLQIGDLTALSTWAQRYVVSPRAEKDLAVYLDEDSRSYAAMSVAAFAALPSAKDRASLALALALPRRGFAPNGAGSRWRRAWAEATALAPWARRR